MYRAIQHREHYVQKTTVPNHPRPKAGWKTHVSLTCSESRFEGAAENNSTYIQE